MRLLPAMRSVLAAAAIAGVTMTKTALAVNQSSIISAKSMGVCPDDSSQNCTSCDQNYFGPRCNINPCLAKSCTGFWFNNSATDGCVAWGTNVSDAMCTCQKGEKPDILGVYIFDFVGVAIDVGFLLFWMRRRRKQEDFTTQWVMPKYQAAMSTSTKIPPGVVLVWRALITLWYASTIIQDLIIHGYVRLQGYLTLTYHNYTLQIIYFAIGLLESVNYLRYAEGTLKEKLLTRKLGGNEKVSIATRIHILLGSIILPLSILVTVVYWFLVHPTRNLPFIEYGNYARHLFNMIFILIEFFMCFSIHPNWRHIPYAFIVVAFFWFYSAVMELFGICPQYGFMYATSWLTPVMIVGLHIGIVLINLMWVGLSKLKLKLYMNPVPRGENGDGESMAMKATAKVSPTDETDDNEKLL